MRRLNQTTRMALIVCAAVASFYAGDRWTLGSTGTAVSQVQLNSSRAAVPTAPTPASHPARVVPATAGERDPTLIAAPRDHVVPASGGAAFAPVSWLPPPPKAPPVAYVAPEPPPAPTAPPLPFTFVGLLEQGMGIVRPKAFLARGDALLVVAAGDTVESTYRIDSVSPQQITLTYLPLKTQQTLNVTGASR